MKPLSGQKHVMAALSMYTVLFCITATTGCYKTFTPSPGSTLRSSREGGRKGFATPCTLEFRLVSNSVVCLTMERRVLFVKEIERVRVK